jgi:hypothetical protein
VKPPTATALVWAWGLGLSCVCGCNSEASGDVVALDGNVELRAPKGFVAQRGRVSHGVAYADPKGAITYRLAGTGASNCQADSLADCLPEYDETIFRCVADGPPRPITPERARDLGFSIEPKVTTTLFTQDVRGIRVLFVRTHDPDPGGADTSDALDAYVFTGGGSPADIAVAGPAKEVDRYGARIRESIASLRSKAAVAWTSPSAEDCKAAATRKKAVESGAVPWVQDDQDVNVAPGSLFGVSVPLGIQCMPDFVVEPATLAVLEGTRHESVPQPDRPRAYETTKATFLARARGDGTVKWTCRVEQAGKHLHGSNALHVGAGAAPAGATP